MNMGNILLGLALLVVAGRYWQLKCQLRRVHQQLAVLVEGNGSAMIELALVDRELEAVAALANRLNADKRRTVAALKRQEALFKEQVANLSHDLRTPLTVILGHLQLLREEALSAAATARVETIWHKADYLRQLVAQFYELSLLDAGAVAPQKSRVNLSNLLMECIADRAADFETRGITPEIHLPAQSIFVETDPQMTVRILENLLSNALRYSQSDITLSLRQEDDDHVFVIANDVAIPPDLDHLFDRFYTADPARSQGGTGLGLAVVKRLCDLLEGDIYATYNDGQLIMTLRLR